MHMIAPQDITGLVLAGGRGSRMGGVDKGLQPFHGLPLAQHTLQRLAPQVGPLLLNANRNLDTYRAWGVEVVTDSAPGTAPEFAGPLAGFLAGLAQCRTPWLLAVACDTPLFPTDLAARMAAAADALPAPLAVAFAPDAPSGKDTPGSADPLRAQPAFCLIHTSVLESLQRFVREGGRKIDRWTALHPLAVARFDQPGDHPHAFANANTLEQLLALEQTSASAPAAPSEPRP